MQAASGSEEEDGASADQGESLACLRAHEQAPAETRHLLFKPFCSRACVVRNMKEARRQNVVFGLVDESPARLHEVDFPLAWAAVSPVPSTSISPCPA